MFSGSPSPCACGKQRARGQVASDSECCCPYGQANDTDVYKSGRLLLPLPFVVLAYGVCAAAGVGLVVQVLAMLVPAHWCRDERVDALQLQLPLSAQQARQFSIPPAAGPAGITYSQCERFADDLAWAYVRWVQSRRPPFRNGSSPLKPCDQGWHYDLSTSFSSISSELDWVCEDSWKPYIAHLSFWISASVGVYLWTSAAKRLGGGPALLLALCVGLLGCAACLLPARDLGLVHVASARAAAGSSHLGGPLLALRLLGRRSAAGATWARAALLLQSVAGVVASCIALMAPSWWWLCSGAAAATALSSLFACWYVFKTFPCTSELSRDESYGDTSTRISLAENTPEPSVTDIAVQYGITCTTSGAYISCWYVAPRLLRSCALPRSGALLALAEGPAWPLLLIPAGAALRRIVGCTAAAVAALLYVAASVLTDRPEMSLYVTEVLAARTAATLAFYCTALSRVDGMASVGRTAASSYDCRAVHAEALTAAGGAVAVFFYWLAEISSVQWALLGMGILSLVGAALSLWEVIRPHTTHIDYWFGYVRTSLKMSVGNNQEGYAKFKNSSLPYDVIENL